MYSISQLVHKGKICRKQFWIRVSGFGVKALVVGTKVVSLHMQAVAMCFAPL